MNNDKLELLFAGAWNDKLFYHGTAKMYHDTQVERFGIYRPDEGFIWLTRTLGFAHTYARNRAREYKSSPLVLVIPITPSLDKRIKADPSDRSREPTIDYLLPDEYTSFEQEAYGSLKREIKEWMMNAR